MTGTIPLHSHCAMCAKPIPHGETLCSEDCRQKYQSLLKRRKIMLYLMYAMLAALLVFLVVSGNFF